MKLSSSTNEIKQQLALNLLEASTNLNLGTYKDTNTRYTFICISNTKYLTKAPP